MIEPGQTYTAYRQGTNITPHTIKIEVVHVDGDSVHYRKEGSQKVEQTTLARFEEITTP